MLVLVEFKNGDFNSLHDTIYDLTEKSLTHNELEVIWGELPENVKAESIRWGIDDSVVRDTIYQYLKENLNLIK